MSNAIISDPNSPQTKRILHIALALSTSTGAQWLWDGYPTFSNDAEMIVRYFSDHPGISQSPKIPARLCGLPLPRLRPHPRPNRLRQHQPGRPTQQNPPHQSNAHPDCPGTRPGGAGRVRAPASVRTQRRRTAAGRHRPTPCAAAQGSARRRTHRRARPRQLPAGHWSPTPTLWPTPPTRGGATAGMRTAPTAGPAHPQNSARR